MLLEDSTDCLVEALLQTWYAKVDCCWNGVSCPFVCSWPKAAVQFRIIQPDLMSSFPFTGLYRLPVWHLDAV